MEEKWGLPFVTQWIDYLNGDEELQKRISKGGTSPSLDGKELVALELEGLSKPCVIGLEGGKFYLKEEKAVRPLVTIRMPLPNFLKMTEDVDERIVWSLLHDEARFSVIEGMKWPDIITVFEIFVALQEMLDKKREGKAA